MTSPEVQGTNREPFSIRLQKLRDAVYGLKNDWLHPMQKKALLKDGGGGKAYLYFERDGRRFRTPVSQITAIAREVSMDPIYDTPK